jgi:hypothetical protein
MGHEISHLAILNKQIQLLEQSSGAINWTDTENMYLDEFESIIYTYKSIYEQKEKAKEDRFKAIFEYVNKAAETLFKLLGNLGKR